MKQLFFFFIFTFNLILAEEGMLIPSLLSAFESDMQARGMKLTADQIYSVNHSSLKDAIIHFGGGCTAELVKTLKRNCQIMAYQPLEWYELMMLQKRCFLE